jgi:hypothetical protein
MASRNFTLSFIVSGFIFKELSRMLILSDLIFLFNYFFGREGYKALEVGLRFTAKMGADIGRHVIASPDQFS